MANITDWKCRANDQGQHIIVTLDPVFHLHHEAFNTETMLILKLLAQTKEANHFPESCELCKSSIDPAGGHAWLMEQHI